MAQLKPVTTGGLLKDVNDNFDALSTVGSFAGLHQRRTAVIVLEVDEEEGLGVKAHTSDVELPANSVIVGGVVDVVKTFTSENDTATIAIHIAAANDVVAAVAIGTAGDAWDAGLHAIKLKADEPESGIKIDADTPVTFTVGVEALTAGKLVLYLDYYEGIATEDGGT